MTKTKIEIMLVEMYCGECGITFGVPDYFKQECLQREQAWYCPNGHCRVFTDEPAEDKAKRLEKELAESKRWQKYFEDAYTDEYQNHNSTKNSLRATRAAKTRLKNRIKNGVCPCCHRHFENLQRHIDTKHPEFTEED